MKFSKYILSFLILSHTLYHKIQYIARIFYYVFLCFFVKKVLTNAEKYVIVIRGVRVLYIMVLLLHFNVLKHDLQGRWTKSPHFPFVPYSIGSNQSGLDFRSSFVVLILSYLNNNVKHFFIIC